MADIERLSIQISADASNATRNINNLVKALERLNKALGSLNTSNVERFSRVIDDLARSVDSLNKGTESVREAAKAFKDLGKSAADVKKAKDATQDLSETSTGLSVVSNNINEVATVSNTLMDIFKRMVASFASINGSTQSLTGEMDVIDTTFREVTGSIYEITAACNELVSAFSQVMASFGAISGSNQKLIEEATIIDTTFREIQEPIEEMGRASEAVGRFAENIDSVDGSSLDEVANSSQRLSYSFMQASNQVDAIKSKFKGIFVPTKSFKSLEDQINNVVKKYNELLAKMQEAINSGNMSIGDEKYMKMAAQLDGLRNQYDELILKQRQLAQEGNAVRLNPTVVKTLDAFKTGFTTVTNLIKNGFVAGVRMANSALKTFRGKLKETFSSMGKTITSGHKATDMAKKFANELLRVSKMLKLMVTRMALRAVIKEVGNGFKSLALHSEEFNQSVSGMMNGAKKLGYSLASMVGPLINALAPAIEYVINLLTKLLNILNQIFSVFAGKTTYNKSKDFTENWAENIESANKSAKELKKTVLGFDELNQLQEKTTSGGDTSNNITDMFETVEIDPKWKEFADWLKNMWKIGDFTELGKKLGEGLRDMLESIPWDLIKSTANKLGGALATLINGFVEVERLGYDIGYTIAQSVNTVFEFLNGFVHKLHWDSIGKFIAETFNGFFENIDWPLIKDTVVTGMAGIAETIQTFIEEFHWDNISNTIINGIDVIASGVLAFIDGIDWNMLGSKIGEQIRKSIEGIDWYQVGEAMGAIIQAAVDWVSGFIENMPSVETLIEKATDMMHGLFDRVSFEEMGANLGIIMQNVYDFLTGFWDANGEEIKNKVKEFFKGFWDNIDKDDLKKVIGKIIEVAAIGGIAYALGEFAKQYIALKFSLLVKSVAGESTVTGAVEAAGSKLGALLRTAFIAGFFLYLGNKLVNGIMKLWGNVYLKGMEEAGYDQSDIDAKKADLDYLYERYDGLGEKVNIFKDAFTGMKDVKLPSDELDNLAIKVEDLRTPVVKIQDDLNQFGKKTEENATRANNALKNVKTEEATKQLDNLNKQGTTDLDSLKTTTEKDTSAIQKSLDDMSKDITDQCKTISSAFTKEKWTFQGVADGLKETFRRAKEAIKGEWNQIANTLNGEHEVGSEKIKIDLPKFAYGGFPEDGLFMANHGEMVGRFSNGKTAVANNAQIVEGISAGVYNAVSSAIANSSGNGSEYIANTIVVDGEVIARTVTKAQQRQNRRYSPAY